MLLNDVEVYINPEDTLIQIIREELSVDDVLSHLVDESSTSEILENIDEDYIVEYCQKKELITYEFEDAVESLKDFTLEQKRTLIWLLIGMDDSITQAEIKRVIEVEIVLPKISNLISLKENI